VKNKPHHRWLVDATDAKPEHTTTYLFVCAACSAVLAGFRLRDGLCQPARRSWFDAASTWGQSGCPGNGDNVENYRRVDYVALNPSTSGCR